MTKLGTGNNNHSKQYINLTQKIQIATEYQHINPLLNDIYAF